MKTEELSKTPQRSIEHPKPMTLKKMLLKSTAMAIGIAFLMLLTTALIFGLFGYSKFKTFLKTGGITQTELIQKITSGWKSQPLATNSHKNFLILGLDTIEGRGDIPALTDTILLASINLENGSVSTLPLPRDLWNEAYQTKINALYHYGQERYPNSPEQFPTKAIAEMTGLDIHHTIIISLDQLETLIDQVGGIEINIEQGFVDTEFPRSGIDVTTERDPRVLYETVVFEKGTQVLDGETALKYIRSRKSQDDQGTDMARSNRQQEVISALSSKLVNFRQYLSDPEMAGKLFNFYNENFSNQLSLAEMVTTLKILYPYKNDISFSGETLSTTLEDYKNGVLDNPRPSYKYQNQWVYVITNLEKFQKEIQDKLIK